MHARTHVRTYRRAHASWPASPGLPLGSSHHESHATILTTFPRLMKHFRWYLSKLIAHIRGELNFGRSTLGRGVRLPGLFYNRINLVGLGWADKVLISVLSITDMDAACQCHSAPLTCRVCTASLDTASKPTSHTTAQLRHDHTIRMALIIPIIQLIDLFVCLFIYLFDCVFVCLFI